MYENELVVVDAGHTGNDPGAVGLGGTRESDIALIVGHKLAAKLQSRGIRVAMTRTEPDEPAWDDLDTRVDAANSAGATLFISLHCNAADNRSAEGMEIWTTRGQTDSDIAANDMMYCMSTTFPHKHVRSDYADGDVDKESDFWVLRWTNMAAVLIEMGFISNPSVEAEMLTEEWQDKMAEAIAIGATGYLSR